MSNKCLRYFVNPQALRQGAEIEPLEKIGVEIIEPDFESQLKAAAWKRNKKVYAPNKKGYYLLEQ